MTHHAYILEGCPVLHRGLQPVVHEIPGRLETVQPSGRGIAGAIRGLGGARKSRARGPGVGGSARHLAPLSASTQRPYQGRGNAPTRNRTCNLVSKSAASFLGFQITYSRLPMMRPASGGLRVVLVSQRVRCLKGLGKKGCENWSGKGMESTDEQGVGVHETTQRWEVV